MMKFIFRKDNMMEIRKWFMTILGGLLIGGILGLCGIYVSNWRFWSIDIPAVILWVLVVDAITDRKDLS